MHDHPDLKEKYFKDGHSKEALEISIEVVIDFIGHCWFKKDIK